MQKITITSDALKLFVFVLDYYVKNQDKWFSTLDELWSSVLGMRNNLTHSTFKDGYISSSEMDQEIAETTNESNAWDNRLGDWRFKRFYLNQYLNFLSQQLREVKNALPY